MPAFTRWRIALFASLAFLQAVAFAAPPTISVSSWPGTRFIPLRWNRPNLLVVGCSIHYGVGGNSGTTYSATGLPTGLTIDSSTGVISGRLQAAGSFNVSVSATNADGTTTATFTTTVQPASSTPPVVSVPTVIRETTQSGFIGRDLSAYIGGFLIEGTNAPATWGVSGLPPGVRFNAETGLIDYTRDSGELVAGVYVSTATATNAAGTGSATTRWEISPRLFVISAENAGTIMTGDTVVLRAQFDSAVVVTGAPTIAMSWNNDANRATARYVSGSGTNILRFEYRTTAADAHAGATTLSTSITLNGGTVDHVSGIAANVSMPSGGTGSGPPSIGGFFLPPSEITSAGSASGELGRNFSFTLTATHAPQTFRLMSGALPPGLTLASSTGVISGTPTQTGTFALQVAAENSMSSGTPPTSSLAITIAAPPSPTTPPPAPPPTVPPPSPPPPVPPVTSPTPIAQTIDFRAPGAITVGQPVTLFASASSGLPVAFSIVAGNATLSGNQLVALDTASIMIRAHQPGNGSFAPVTTTLTVQARSGQLLDFVSPVSAIIIGQPVRLSAMASSGLPVTFTIVSGPATITGDALTVTGPGPVVVRATQAGSESVAPITADVTITAGRAGQTIALAANAGEMMSDRPLALTATASSGLPVTFEIVSGPATLRGNVLTATAATGEITLRALQPGSEAFAPATLTRTISVRAATRLINLSSRVRVRAGDPNSTFIAGFVVSGDAPKRMLIRAIGPALAGFGVQAALADPQLRVFDAAGRVVADNDDWAGAEITTAAARVGAFALAPGSGDAALLLTLPPGNYSLHVTAGAGEGIALAEVYDASDTPALEAQQLINISTRAGVDTGEAVLTAGFVVTGSTAQRVLIRGIGPGLTAFGVAGALADPVLRLFQGNTVIAQNDNWDSAEVAAASVSAGAFALASGSKDAALVVTLPPGAYTATVAGANDGAGAGLVEVYQLRE